MVFRWVGLRFRLGATSDCALWRYNYDLIEDSIAVLFDGTQNHFLADQ